MGKKKNPDGTWTQERVFEESHKYKTFGEFNKQTNAAYDIARIKGWLAEMTWLSHGHKCNYYNTNKHWSYETIINESKKYSSRSEFEHNAGTAYRIARLLGYLDGMTWLKSAMHNKRGPYKNVKVTKEIIFKISRKYEYIMDFQNANEYAYKKVLKYGWLKDMPWLQKKNHTEGYWTNERVFEESHKYQTRVEFANTCSFAYKVAQRNDWLKDMDWLQNKQEYDLKDLPIYTIYAYLEKKRKVAYVGLTKRKLKTRDWEHRQLNRDKKDVVLDYFHSIGKEIPQPVILMENLRPEEAQIAERKFSDYYYEKGYNLLNNKNKTGKGKSSLGYYKFWTPENVLEEAKKYNNASDFKKGSPGAYKASITYSMRDKMTWIKPKKRIEPKWNKEAVFIESHKYQNYYEFRKAAIGAYNKAKKNGWLSAMPWLNYKKPIIIRKWTRDAVFKEAHKYESRGDFRKNSGPAYQVALKNKWIIEMTWFVPQRVPNGFWTKATIFEASQKHKSRTKFIQRNSSAYNIARSKGWLNEMPWLADKKKPNGYWNDKDKVFAESKKYSSRTEFSHNAYTAHKMAKKNGWLEDMPWLNKNRYNFS